MTLIHGDLTAKRESLPKPADADAVALALERWEAAAGAAEPEIAERARAIADDADGRAVLSAIFGNSPYLTQCAVRDIGFACDLLSDGAQNAWDGALAAMTAVAPHETGTEEIMSRLRIAKRRCSLATAAADLTGAWSVEKVCQSLSDLASGALTVAADHLLAKAAEAGEIALPSRDAPSRGSGWIILGMGKLGARELNYSSDIDLIVLYDAERAEYIGKSGVQRCMVRMTQELVRIMAEATGDGYVFRTDLRLRPDPGSTPLAISTRAAEVYYESAGQNWERAAMIKARPVAGDIEAGNAFIEILRPFIWRKSLDFAAIQDIHSIKRQINAQRGGSEIAIAAHNIKLGRGGIREIEFFAQTQQLIWGGRDPNLRVRATCEALRALVGAELLESIVSSRLIQAYRFHRRLENRLQMVDDRQTHSMPEDEAGRARIAYMMGFPDRETFEDSLIAELRAVESHYAVLFEKTPDLSGPGSLVFTGADNDPETLETLAGLGYRDPAMVAERIRIWHHGRYSATRSARARELLTELIPTILEALSKTIDPDAALLKFDGFLRGLPAGVQILSLLANNPRLLELLARIMGSAPRLADWLSRYPILLDGVLVPEFGHADRTLESLREQLSEALDQARDFEDVLDICRRWNNDRIFEIGVEMLDQRVGGDAASPFLSDVATACVEAILPPAAAEFQRNHGAVPGSAFAIVAFGKLGSRELTVESDLDLMFLYEAPDELTESDGARPLASQTYYARLCQRFIGAMSAPTGEGRLYEVDMRLRPAGASGPIATSLEGFTRYQNSDAWTWEHLALTRARVVLAPDALARQIDDTIKSVLTRERDPAALVRDVADMRERMDREHATDDWLNIKYFRGGMIDIEFIAQYLQLAHAHHHANVLSPNTADALKRLAAAGCLAGELADDLVDALTLWRRLQGIVRLAFGSGASRPEQSADQRDFIAHAAGAEDFASLEADVLSKARRAHEHFETLIGEPGRAAAAEQED